MKGTPTRAGRSAHKKKKLDFRFAPVPMDMLDSREYQSLSHPAKALLFEAIAQYLNDNNGRMVLTKQRLQERGWKSADVLNRAKRELIEAGFLVETVKGHRPNKASWYACTCYHLDRHPDYDSAAVKLFRRGAWREESGAPIPSPGPAQVTSLSPSPGPRHLRIVPSPGPDAQPAGPSPGTVRAPAGTLSGPSPGLHLEMPSAAEQRGVVKDEAMRTTKRPHSATAEALTCPTEHPLTPVACDSQELGAITGDNSTWRDET